MELSNSYCNQAFAGKLSQLHKAYHQTSYGFKAANDNELFGSLILEINQAGLSWNTVLNKKDTIKKAYADYSIQKIAAFRDADIAVLMNNPRIIRMRGKITAIIYNANQILKIQKEAISFEKWLDSQGTLSVEDWIILFKKHFKFTGKEITKEFLMGNGYLEGAHEKGCPIYEKSIAAHPIWYVNKT